MTMEALIARTILRQFGLITYMVPIGISHALGTITGNYVGRGSYMTIKYFYKLSLVAIGIYCALIIILFVFLES